MHTEIKKCPRCGKELECNNYNILKCACVLIPLSAEARQMIAENYVDCLCIDCLKEIEQKSQKVITTI